MFKFQFKFYKTLFIQIQSTKKNKNNNSYIIITSIVIFNGLKSIIKLM